MYDLIIIGGGPAGLTAGIYACRARLNTLLLEKTYLGGQILLSNMVENYPGFLEISGAELMEKIIQQSKKFSLSVIMEEVVKLEIKEELYLPYTRNNHYDARTIILASGVRPKTLGIKREKELIGKGVSYCAVCDGPLFRDKVVAVVGGGNAAVKESLFLAGICRKVYLIHRRKVLRAEKILQERIFHHPKIEICWESLPEEILGKDQVEGIVLRDLKKNRYQQIIVEGVFIYVGMEPNTDFVPPEIKKDSRGFIITGENLETSQPGIFAAGDCRAKLLRQVATAVGDGALSAAAVEDYLSRNR